MMRRGGKVDELSNQLEIRDQGDDIQTFQKIIRKHMQPLVSIGISPNHHPIIRTSLRMVSKRIRMK